MYQKSRRFQTKIITYAVLVIFSLLVIGVFVYSYVSKYQENKPRLEEGAFFFQPITLSSNVKQILCLTNPRPSLAKRSVEKVGPHSP